MKPFQGPIIRNMAEYRRHFGEVRVTIHGKPIGEWYNMPNRVLVVVEVPDDTDPAMYLARIIPAACKYHIAVTEDSAHLMIEQRDSVIAELNAQLERLRNPPARDEYIVRLHKSDPQRLGGHAGGVSLRQCNYCHALVVEDYLPAHEDVCPAGN